MEKLFVKSCIQYLKCDFWDVVLYRRDGFQTRLYDIACYMIF